MSDLISETFVLTVAEGKRLIALGVAALDCVQTALESGMVIVCKGSTNAYVAEELLGRRIAKGAYVLGRTVPEGAQLAEVFAGSLPEVILVQGEPVEMSLDQAIEQAQAGDVVIKGANALNYDTGLAGLLVGHPTGGTLGKIIGAAYGKGLHLVIPVGLEKEIAEDIQDLAELINHEPEISRPTIPALWPVQGEIVTEIEALEGLTGVEAHQIAAGGLCGAEGGMWLAVWGETEQVEAARRLMTEVQGEPPFAQAAQED
jgi:hypothetical protein